MTLSKLAVSSFVGLLAACTADPVDPSQDVLDRAQAGLDINIQTPVSKLSKLPAGCGVSNPDATNYRNAETQPHLVADPRNPFHLVANFQQDRWSKFGGNAIVTMVSDNLGLSWRPARKQPRFTRCAGGTYEVATDSWLSVAPDGTLVQVAFAINTVESYATAIVASRSTDGGETWSDPATLIEDTDPRYFNDRPTVTADPTRPGHFYVVWDRLDDTSTETEWHYRGPMYIARSTDNGRTWDTPRAVLDTPENQNTLGHQLVVLADGTLVDAFTLFTLTNARFQITRSLDGGTTWSPAIDIAPMPFANGFANPDGGDESVRNGATPTLVTSPDRKTVYATWVSGDGETGPQHAGFSRSTDGGTTWSAPVNVDKTSATQSSFLPTIAVAKDGRIAITYYDLRSNTPDPAQLLADFWMVTCDHDCTQPASWTEKRVAGSFDVLRAPQTGLGRMVGDYTGLVGLDFGLFVTVFARTNDSATNPQDIIAAILR